MGCEFQTIRKFTKAIDIISWICQATTFTTKDNKRSLHINPDTLKLSNLKSFHTVSTFKLIHTVILKYDWPESMHYFCILYFRTFSLY